MNRWIQPLAELIVRFGANVQPGQIVALSSEPGKEPLARAVAEQAYKSGARFVDLTVFDAYLKRARLLYADPDTLSFVPPWYGERIRALGMVGAARIHLTGPVAPRALEGIDPALAARDMLPRVRESLEVVNERTTNWTIGPCPTLDWAELVHPELEPGDALARLWEEIARICRLDEPDPIDAWRARFAQLAGVATKLDDLSLDSLRFEGPGTDLTVGLFESSHWLSGADQTASGIEHAPNLPTEEVFTTPDPDRVEGVVRSTKPLIASGKLITGLVVRFEGGRAVEISADEGAETLQGLTERDPNGTRLGEVALVDRESRIDTVYFVTLLDENAASHIALGQGYASGVLDEQDRERINASEIHVDFMIGSDEVTVTGVTRDGRSVPLLRGGEWQI
jgi:aminopeptidase